MPARLLPAQECNGTPGCNAWTFCWQGDGCGSGCVRAPNPSEDKTLFGPFGGCAPGDKYPPFMCTLKHVPDPAAPPLYPDSGAAGWTSGVVLAAAPSAEP